jgi:hypothetical protein
LLPQLPWEKRPFEIANLLNPAFCSLLLGDSIAAFQKENEEGMPYPLSFLVLPLVLHEATRETFPKTTQTKLRVWLKNYPEVRFMFVERTRQLVPYTKESILFGMQKRTISVNEKGNLISKKRLENLPWPNQSEPAICREKSKFLGRWFALTGNASTIFIIFGVRP